MLPGDVKDGTKSTSANFHKTVVSYTCNSGFRLVGSATRTCQDDGTWSGEHPRCIGTVRVELETLLKIKVKEVFKIVHSTCDQVSYDLHSYERNLCNCVCRSLKNSGLQRGLNP